MRQWNVEYSDSGIEVISSAVSFRVSPAAGGTLHDLRWGGDVPHHAHAKISTTLVSGSHYDRFGLNQLPNPLAMAEGDPLTVEQDDTWIEIVGRWRVHDLTGIHRIRADADRGEIRISDRIEKAGPGSMRLQVMHRFSYPLDQDERGPTYVVTVPQGDEQQTYWAFSPVGDRIWDQDGRKTRRHFLLTDPWLEIGVAGDRSVTRLIEDGQLACAALELSPKHKQYHLQLYAPDTHVTREKPMQRDCRIAPPRALDANASVPAAPEWQPERRKQVQRQADAMGSRLSGAATGQDRATELRRDLAAWKLRQTQWYMRNGEYDQAQALLADADVALDAVECQRATLLPTPKELLYANDFKTFPHDWNIFGYADIRHDPENGLHLAPMVTVNMWTAQQYEGPYLVEFEYKPTSANATNGGTFLQLAGQCINPGDHLDFMASAMGKMPYYNFGTSCYHLSFNRGDSVQSVCNFRKTGRDFHLLAQVPDPPMHVDCWYRISVVKNHQQFLFYLDGQLILEYLDHGHQGPVLDKGHIGIRNWAGQQSWIRNFRISRI